MTFEVALVAEAQPPLSDIEVVAEHREQLVHAPDVELALDALGVGIQRRVEAALGARHLAQDPVERLLGRAAQERVARDLPAVQVRASQQRVVVEHLLEVRHGPAGVDRVAGEAPADLVVDAARGHRPQGLQSHRQFVTAQQELDHRRRWELRRRAPAAVDGVKARPQLRDGRVERVLARWRVGGLEQRCTRQPRDHRLALRADLLALLLPRVRDAFEDRRPARHPAALLGRKVRTGVERNLLGRDEDVQRPAAVAGHRLHGLHVERVDVGALLPIDLHADEALVHLRGDRGVLEGLALHHVTPMACGVADRDEQRAVELARPA